MMENRNGIILGVANKCSIAWAAAQERGGAGRGRHSTTSIDPFATDVEDRRRADMRRPVNERGTSNKETVARRTAAITASRQEKQMELESRLQIQEMEARDQMEDARWRRLKEMIFVVTLACLALVSFTIWAVILLSRSYPSAEKQLITVFIVQLLVNLFVVVAGKKTGRGEDGE